MNHKNICGPALSAWDKGYRDFDSLDEMNDTIINNMNSVIMPEDRLIFCGDFLFGMDKLENFKKFWARINTKNVITIFGNHDVDWMLKRDNLAEVEKIVGKVYDVYEENIDGEDCWFCHYPPEEYYSRANPHNVSYTREGRETEFKSDFIRDHRFFFSGHNHHTVKTWGRNCDIGIDVEIPEIGHKKYFPFELKPLMSYLRSRP